MKTCEDCLHFVMDVVRTQKLGEPIGKCKMQVDHGYVIGCFDVEDCDGFDALEYDT